MYISKWACESKVVMNHKIIINDLAVTVIGWTFHILSPLWCDISMDISEFQVDISEFSDGFMVINVGFICLFYGHQWHWNNAKQMIYWWGGLP